VALGEPTEPGVSQVNLAAARKAQVTFDVAALLVEKPTPETERIRSARLDSKPYWHVERSRIGGTRTVPVDFIRHGVVVDRREIEADGKTQSTTAEIDIPESSWVAVRILPSVHTNPIWVTVADQPIRVPRSAKWCQKAVDICWEAK